MKASLQALTQGGALQRKKLQTISDTRKKWKEEEEARRFNIGNAIIDAAAAFVTSGGDPLATFGAAAFAPHGDFDPATSVQQGSAIGTGVQKMKSKGAEALLRAGAGDPTAPTALFDQESLGTLSGTLQALDPKQASKGLQTLTKYAEDDDTDTDKLQTISTDKTSQYLQSIGGIKAGDSDSYKKISSQIQVDPNLTGKDKITLQKYVNKAMTTKPAKPDEPKVNVYGETLNRIDQLKANFNSQSSQLKTILDNPEIAEQKKLNAAEKFKNFYMDQINDFRKVIRKNPDMRSSELQELEERLNAMKETLEMGYSFESMPRKRWFGRKPKPIELQVMQ